MRFPRVALFTSGACMYEHGGLVIQDAIFLLAESSFKTKKCPSSMQLM